MIRMVPVPLAGQVWELFTVNEVPVPPEATVVAAVTEVLAPVPKIPAPLPRVVEVPSVKVVPEIEEAGTSK
jgi:hypothetical protein